MTLRRDWTAALEKCSAEGHCRWCGRSDVKLDCAHVIGRRADERNGNVAVVNPDSVVPLCGPSTDSRSCHGRYDMHRLDLLPVLTVDEEVQAVRDAGGLELARRRIIGASEKHGEEGS